MKDLDGLYQEMLWDLDELKEIISNINAARLKKVVLRGIRTFISEEWKIYFISIRRTCRKMIVTQSSHQHGGIVLARTAKIICKLYILVTSRTRFRVNPHYIVAWMSRNALLEAGAKYEVYVIATGLKPRTT